MRGNQISQQFPAGFPGMVTNRNIATQTIPAISLDIHYNSQVLYYDKTPVASNSPYDNQELLLVTGKYKTTNVNYTLAGVAGIALFDNSATQGQQYAFQTPQDQIIQYQAGVQFTVQPLAQLVSDLVAIKASTETGGALALGSKIAVKIPTANSTALDAITYYAFAPDATIPADYIGLPYIVIAINLQRQNDSFLYNGTDLSLCRIKYQMGV
jgi:hypothetical protein